MADLSFLTDGSHEQVVYVTHRAARAARLEALPADLPPALAAALADRGITELFSHQRRVWDLLAAGRNVVVSTGTASGKSLSFALPDARRLRPRPPQPGALRLPHQGARPGPGPQPRRAAPAGRGRRPLRR